MPGQDQVKVKIEGFQGTGRRDLIISSFGTKLSPGTQVKHRGGNRTVNV